MGTKGGQVGNSNAAKGKPWAAAIERALAKRSKVKKREALDELAEALLSKCDEHDMQALKELGDRLDGKPAQTIAGTGEDGAHKFEVTATWMKEAAKNRGW